MENIRQWERVKELFDAALKLDPGQRDAFLRDACGPDDPLRVEVESLLSAHADSDDLWQHPWPTEFLKTPAIPDSIGPYRLIKKIGEGGMGQVWLAEQTAPLQRQVVLKLIRAGMYDDSKIRRFQAERQSLAIMDHPAIAKVFDAGATPDGQPYFVMEYVPGEQITAYCDRKKLKVRERLDLFLKVCEGVQHAHQKAIIHRDLKPANILVLEVDGRPAPRIIDFGLAKAVDAAAGETLFTQAGGLLGTPGYISPEQADPNCKDIDTRTDVYSLGVLLYELLTGLLPFDTEKWKNQPLYEVMRQLKEQDPPRPSTRVEMAKDSSTSSAEMRGTEPGQLVSLLHGDLDWITMKALEKERARRYGTPSELAADIRRYLNNEPVVARPASAGYRVYKYVRRHRVAVSATAVLILLLAGFAAAQAVQLRRITAERDRTTRERDRANRITTFMTGMFHVSDPGEARGNSITAREILDKASKDIDTGLAKDPESQAQMMYVMGKVYQNLGLYSQSQSLLEKASEIDRRVFGPDNAETLKAVNELGTTLFFEGHFPEAEKMYRETYEILLRTVGPKHLNTAKVLGNLGAVLTREGHYADAEKSYREALEILRNALGTDDPNVLIVTLNLAAIEISEGHLIEAEKLDRDTLEVHRRVLGPDHPETLKTMNNLIVILNSEGRFSEGEKLARQTVDLRRRVLGSEHPDTLSSLRNLADALHGEGRFLEAEELDREALRLRNRALGPENWETLQSEDDLSSVLSDEGRYAEADKLGREALDAKIRLLGPQSPETSGAEVNLAAVLENEGKCTEAEKMGREAVDANQKIFGQQHPGTINAINILSLALACNGHYDEAVKLAQEAFDAERRFPWSGNSKGLVSRYYLACIAAMRGRHDEALTLLRDSVDSGLSPRLAMRMDKDPNLKSLAGEPRFQAIAEDAKTRATAAQKAD